MAAGGAFPHALATPGAAVTPRHLGGDATLIEKD